MKDVKSQDYANRVADILKVFRHTYGVRADLVNVHPQTIGTPAYGIMKTILSEQKIAIETDERVAVGKFMFLNRELAVSNIL